MTKTIPGDIWVLAEPAEGGIRPVTYEVLSFAARVAEAVRGRIVALLIGQGITLPAERMATETGLLVVGVQTDPGNGCRSEVYRHILSHLTQIRAPRFLFLPHTTLGWDLAPGLSVDIGASILTAVCGLLETRPLTFERAILGGKLIEHVRPAHPERPTVVTVVPGADKPYKASPGRRGDVVLFREDAPPTRGKVKGQRRPPPRTVDLRKAQVIVAAGRGASDPENLSRIQELAALFRGGAVGASRPVCDAGLLPLGCQVGMTGQTVSPRLYLACGISGAVQHTMGMKDSGLVVVINKDRNAPFCREAHYCVPADLNAFLPLLIEKIRRFRNEQGH